MITKLRTTWENTIKKYSSQPLKYLIAESIDDISEAVKMAEADNVRLRAIGSGHSFSDVAITDGYLVDISRLCRILKLDKSRLKDPDSSDTLVYVEGGITIQEFNKKMEDQDLCVLNMGGIDEQTLAGAISTGTHGTGIDLPAFYGMVKAMVVVTHGGQIQWIEPTNGITEKTSFNDPKMTLVQDDEIFNSVVVGLGCMGVIYAYVLQMEKMYWLAESKELTTWDAVKPKLADRSLFEKDDQGNQKYRGIMVQMSPYLDKKGIRNCIVVRHQLLPGKPHRTLGDRMRNIISSVAGSIPITYWFLQLMIRFFPKVIPGLVSNSLKSLRDKSYENKGYKVLYQGVEYVKLRAYDGEYAFDMKNNNNNFLSALEDMFDKARELAEKDRLYQTSPMGLRFVQGLDAYICADYQKQVCYIDTPSVLNTPGIDEILNIYQDIMLSHDGIPHWGKIHNRIVGRTDLIKKHFPALNKWEKVFNQMNPNGTFNNDFTDRLQLGRLTV